jgi:hypothetical protein
MSFPKLRTAQGQATVGQVNAGHIVVPKSAGRTVTVVDAWLRAIGGAVGAADGIDVVDTFLHKMADVETWDAAVPANDEAKSYATSIELIADHNIHTASTAYHQAATAAVSSTAATTEATLIAQVNVMRTAQLAHYANVAVHGGIADMTRYALVAATVVATTAATAIVLENLLQVYHVAHIAATTALSTVFATFATAALTQNTLVRAGAANTTATNLLASGTVGEGVKLVKSGANIGTAGFIDYSVSYVVT